MARSRAYRWGEDGLMGITDRQCRLCLALALWNTKDPILKERLFGLNGHQVNVRPIHAVIYIINYKVLIDSKWRKLNAFTECQYTVKLQWLVLR